MTRSQMIEWLQQRYTEQCEQFPTLRSIPQQQYVAANISHMLRTVYWIDREAFAAADGQS